MKQFSPLNAFATQKLVIISYGVGLLINVIRLLVSTASICLLNTFEDI